MRTPETWLLGDVGENRTAAEFVIGHLDGDWEADVESLRTAVLSVLSYNFMQGGLSPEEATEQAWACVDGGVRVLWDGENLMFDMPSDEEENGLEVWEDEGGA